MWKTKIQNRYLLKWYHDTCIHYICRSINVVRVSCFENYSNLVKRLAGMSLLNSDLRGDVSTALISLADMTNKTNPYIVNIVISKRIVHNKTIARLLI